MNEKKIFLLLNKHVAAETHGVPRDSQDEPTQEPTLDNEIRIKEQRYTLTYNRMLEKIWAYLPPQEMCSFKTFL